MNFYALVSDGCRTLKRGINSLKSPRGLRTVRAVAGPTYRISRTTQRSIRHVVTVLTVTGLRLSTPQIVAERTGRAFLPRLPHRLPLIRPIRLLFFAVLHTPEVPRRKALHKKHLQLKSCAQKNVRGACQKCALVACSARFLKVSRRSSGVEHVIGNDGVRGSIPLGGTISRYCTATGLARYSPFSAAASASMASRPSSIRSTLTKSGHVDSLATTRLLPGST